MAVITIMLMSTAAAGIFPDKKPDEVIAFEGGVVGVAASLEATFGSSAKIIFCFGLFSAAYSSFLVNLDDRRVHGGAMGWAWGASQLICGRESDGHRSADGDVRCAASTLLGF